MMSMAGGRGLPEGREFLNVVADALALARLFTDFDAIRADAQPVYDEYDARLDAHSAELDARETEIDRREAALLERERRLAAALGEIGG
jgi:hypothetical protein